MNDLIAQLKAAPVGSRELDLAMFNAMETRKPECRWRFLDPEQEIVTRDEYGPRAPGNPIFGLERFTTSVDDAAVLVPGEIRWYVEQCYGELSHCYAGVGYGLEASKAATCALALCMAALHYRTATTPTAARLWPAGDVR